MWITELNWSVMSYFTFNWITTLSGLKISRYWEFGTKMSKSHKLPISILLFVNLIILSNSSKAAFKFIQKIILVLMEERIYWTDPCLSLSLYHIFVIYNNINLSERYVSLFMNFAVFDCWGYTKFVIRRLAFH